MAEIAKGLGSRCCYYSDPDGPPDLNSCCRRGGWGKGQRFAGEGGVVSVAAAVFRVAPTHAAPAAASDGGRHKGVTVLGGDRLAAAVTRRSRLPGNEIIVGDCAPYRCKPSLNGRCPRLMQVRSSPCVHEGIHTKPRTHGTAGACVAYFHEPLRGMFDPDGRDFPSMLAAVE